MLFKKFLSEIGKLLSVLFVSYDDEHFFVNKIISFLKDTCGIAEMTKERISNIIKYGFMCSKNKTPIIYTNIDGHVKDKVVKHAEFSDAITELNNYGTSLNSELQISMPNNGVCVIVKDKAIPITQRLGTYPNSKDNFENTYFGCNCNPQAIRIGMREFCSTQNFPNARNSPNVIFYILNQMSLMCIKGYDMDSEYMQEFRKLAIAQTSMENMISKGQYSGIGFYDQWKTGKSVPIHFSSPKLHSSLYTDRMINPLQLSEPLWWALMMSMLGLFKEQYDNYDTALDQINVRTEDEFHQYLRTEYSDKINGNLEFLTINNIPNSVFTLDNFDQTDEVYYLKPHYGCSTNTHYSKYEIDNYVLNNGCVWCHYVPNMSDFEKVDNLNNNENKIRSALTKSSRLVVKQGEIQNFENNFIGQNDTKKIRINMVGITGAGKSFATQKMANYLTQKGAQCLVINSDKWSKQGITGNNQQQKVFQEISKFNKIKSNFKVIIVDLCNESGASQICFGYNLGDYVSKDYLPNFHRNAFEDYEAWCLNNVLSRPIHTNDTDYWLNPVSAGIDTCIKVHNAKASKLKIYLGLAGRSTMYNERLSITEILNQIKPKSDRYARVLAQNSLDSEIKEFIDRIC